MSNRQTGNVGNEGDILKHAALVAVAQELAEATGSRLLYVDTHAFVVTAPLADRAWSQVAAELPEEAERYRSLERSALAAGEGYLCSTGLVAEVWKGRDFEFVVGERDSTTRAELADGLRPAGVVPSSWRTPASLLTGSPEWHALGPRSCSSTRSR